MNRKIWSKIDKYSKKLKSINYLGGCCEMCGENSIFKLCFHHLNPECKEFDINDIIYKRWSIIKNEIDKCQLLCRNCHNKLHFDNQKINRYKNNKKIFLEFKGINGCEKCGYNECNASLDFHHINDDKIINLGKMSIQFNSIEDLTEKVSNELNKCIVICRNCHSLEHSDVEFYNEYMNEIIEKSENIKEVQKKIDRNIVKDLYNNGMRQIDISKYLQANKSTISDIIKEIKGL